MCDDEICIYNYPEENKDPSINIEYYTYISTWGTHFDLLICVRHCFRPFIHTSIYISLFFNDDLEYMVGDLDSAVALLNNKD